MKRIVLTSARLAVLYVMCAVFLARPANAQGQPKEGWYVGLGGSAGRQASLALKLERRGALFQVTGVYNDNGPSHKQSQVRGAYSPSKNALTGTWSAALGGGRKRKLNMDGTYDAAADAFDVTLLDITGGGPARLPFHCVRARQKEVKRASLAGRWLVKKEGWVINFTQHDNVVEGTYSGGQGATRANGTIRGTFDGRTLQGRYVHNMAGGAWKGVVRGTLVDERTLTATFTDDKYKTTEKYTATRAR